MSSLRRYIAHCIHLAGSQNRQSCPPTNPNTFHKRFGLSCQNDIDHISTFAPYVDALTTDDKMRNLCNNDVVADELKQFSCKIFSNNNYDEFKDWLDALIAEPVMHNIKVQQLPGDKK